MKKVTCYPIAGLGRDTDVPGLATAADGHWVLM